MSRVSSLGAGLLLTLCERWGFLPHLLQALLSPALVSFTKGRFWSLLAPRALWAQLSAPWGSVTGLWHPYLWVSQLHLPRSPPSPVPPGEAPPSGLETVSRQHTREIPGLTSLVSHLSLGHLPVTWWQVLKLLFCISSRVFSCPQFTWGGKHLWDVFIRGPLEAGVGASWWLLFLWFHLLATVDL